MCYANVTAPFPAKISNVCTDKSPQDPPRNGGATEDVEVAGRAKLSPEKEPTYEKKVNPNPRNGHFPQKHEQNKLNSGHQKVHFY